MEESNLGAVSFGEFDEDWVERFDAASGEILQKTTQGNKIVGLSSWS